MHDPQSASIVSFLMHQRTVMTRFFSILCYSYKFLKMTSVVTLPTASIGYNNNNHTMKYIKRNAIGPDITVNFNDFVTALG